MSLFERFELELELEPTKRDRELARLFVAATLAFTDMTNRYV